MDWKDRTWICTVVVADIVGFAKKSVEEQTRAKAHFSQVVQDLIKDVEDRARIVIDTGDGAAICFLGDPEDALNAALSMCGTVNDDGKGEHGYELRIAVNVGPLKIVEDVNGNVNAIGDGINTAVRLLGFALPGRLVASRSFVDLMSPVAEKYSEMFQASGTHADKHGREHEIFILAGSEPIPGMEKSDGALPSIAVLPLIDMSPDKDQEYFCEGMAEEIIGALSRVEGLVVVSRTSSFRYKNTNDDIRDIAKQLNVSTVLEGSVRKAGDQLRVTAQLIDASNGFHLWTEQYDRETKDMFAIQNEIASSIAARLKGGLCPSNGEVAKKGRTENTEAHDLYLKGRYVLQSRSKSGIENGIDYFERAIALDERFALAYTGLADSYNLMAFYHYLPPREAFPKAKRAALQALELDDGLAEAHSSVAVVDFYYDWNWAGAEREFLRALELNSNEEWALHIYAELLGATGRLDEAEEFVQRTIRLDPLSATKNALVGWNHVFNKRYEEAIDHLETSLVLNPEYPFLNVFLSSAYFATERYKDAILHLTNALAGSMDDQAMLGLLSFAYGKFCDLERGGAHLWSLERLAQDRYVSSYYVSVAQMGQGMTDKALDSLEKAVEERCPQIVFLAADPLFDSMRAEERFKQVLETVGL